MVKTIDSKELDTSKLRDLAGSLAAVTAKSLELKPILEGLARPTMPGIAIPDMKWRTEGGVSVLEKEFAVLQAALHDARGRISPALRTLKRSLR